jgi:periplasmic protein TonB
MNTYDESSFVSGRKGAALAAVVLLHVVVGFAFYSGLAVQIAKTFNPPPLDVKQVVEPKEAVKLPPPLPLVEELKLYVPHAEVPTLNVPPDEWVSVPPQIDTAHNPPPMAVPVGPSLPKASTGIRIDPKHPLRIGEEYYPDAAKRANEEGRCVVQMTVAIDGRISGAVINSSSGFARLDEACLSAVRGQRMVPATENGKPVEKTVTMPITWKLTTTR